MRHPGRRQAELLTGPSGQTYGRAMTLAPASFLNLFNASSFGPVCVIIVIVGGGAAFAALLALMSGETERLSPAIICLFVAFVAAGWYHFGVDHTSTRASGTHSLSEGRQRIPDRPGRPLP